MAVCPHALSDPRAEVTLQESNQELPSQLAQIKWDFQALMEEFLVSEAAAYSLATELQKHKCGECKDIIESVLGDKLPFEEGKLAEESTLAKKLRESNLLIQEQEQQLAYLRHKLQEGREVWALLSQHLNDLLTHNGSDDHQGQAFRQQLAEGYRLAKHLAHILGPGNNEDKEDEKTQGTLTHRPYSDSSLSFDRHEIFQTLDAEGLGFDASLRGKKPPKLEGDALEGSAALSAQKQKIIKRKLLFNKWRITCNFPSLQLRVLRYQDLWN
nr:putative neuroblastoma breakpoint family member 5 isoform X1 [Equus asinus]